MVSQHFKLREQPFGVTPDPKYMYASASHREALASLLYGLQSGLGFVSLIAKPGMGKTTLLFEVLSRLRDTRTTVFLFQTIATPVDLLRAILIDLGVREVRENLVDLQTQLNNVLLSQCAARKPVVVVIDEAQNLNDSVLETVRMLSNFETASQKLMQIILAGQPQLAEKLMTPDLLQLRQRISIFAHLTPLSMTETSAYVLQRLTLAGLQAGEQIFTPFAMALIARYSEGIPRNINNLCFNSMSLAFALKRSKIDSEIVNEVLSDLNIREHLLSVEGSYQFEANEKTPWAPSPGEEFTGFENKAGESDANGSIESPTASLPELQTSKTWKPLINEHPPLAVNVSDAEPAPELAFVADQPHVYDRSKSSTNTHQAANTAVERTPRVDDYLTLPVVEPPSPPTNDRHEQQVGARWLEQEIPEQKSHLNDRPHHVASNPRSIALGDEGTSDDMPLGKPIFAAFESRSRWRLGPASWNHTAIIATIASVALCMWLGFVDYRILFPKEADQASSRAAAPVLSSNDGQSVDQSESAPSTAPQHRGSIRVKKVESLATLCNSIYGECNPDLMEQLLVLNPSILYPNRLRPGQIISIPLDTHNAKTER